MRKICGWSVVIVLVCLAGYGIYTFPLLQRTDFTATDAQCVKTKEVYARVQQETEALDKKLASLKAAEEFFKEVDTSKLSLQEYINNKQAQLELQRQQFEIMLQKNELMKQSVRASYLYARSVETAVGTAGGSSAIPEEALWFGAGMVANELLQ